NLDGILQPFPIFDMEHVISLSVRLDIHAVIPVGAAAVSRGMDSWGIMITGRVPVKIGGPLPAKIKIHRLNRAAHGRPMRDERPGFIRTDLPEHGIDY